MDVDFPAESHVRMVYLSASDIDYRLQIMMDNAASNT